MLGTSGFFFYHDLNRMVILFSAVSCLYNIFAPWLQMYHNFTIFNLVFISKMLYSVRLCYSASSMMTYPVTSFTYTSKKPMVWCSWQTEWRLLFCKFLIKVCPHYMCFGSDLGSNTCVSINVGCHESEPKPHCQPESWVRMEYRSTKYYGMWPINIKFSQKIMVCG